MANQNVKAEKIHFSGRTSSDFEYDASNMFQKTSGHWGDQMLQLSKWNA